MRVHVDPDVCQGHARCLAVAPEAFAFDDDTHQAAALPDERIAAVPTARLLEAARSCPERAITVDEGADG